MPSSTYLPTNITCRQRERKPFFWLGDTKWELFQPVLQKKTLLFTCRTGQTKVLPLIQAVLLAEMDGLNTPNVYGHKPLINNDPAKPDEKYFQHVDFMPATRSRQATRIGHGVAAIMG